MFSALKKSPTKSGQVRRMTILGAIWAGSRTERRFLKDSKRRPNPGGITMPGNLGFSQAD